MTMTKAVSFPVLSGGILLVTLGIGASATDNPIWMLVSGVVATVLGLVGLFRTSRTPDTPARQIHEEGS